MAQQDGDDQGNEEQEAGARQGNPDEDLTGEVPLVGPCRKREEGRSTRCSWLVLQPALAQPRDLLAFGKAGGEAEVFPWPPAMPTRAAQAFGSAAASSSFQGSQGRTRSFLTSPAKATTSPSPQGFTLPPPLPSVPSHETSSCFLHHPQPFLHGMKLGSLTPPADPTLMKL